MKSFFDIPVMLKAVFTELSQAVPNGLLKVSLREVKQGVWEPMVLVKVEYFDRVAQYLRDQDSFQMDQLIDVVAMDFPEQTRRFGVTYHLLSVRWNQRMLLKTWVDEVTRVPSLCAIYPNADWCEREVFDMYGVIFENHPDLRRIMTDYGFQGHPLRKDFPCTGFTEVRYDELEKRVVVEGIELAQEYRQFDFTTPWEQAPRFQRKVARKECVLFY
jgi:NADH/F420H2 dehydrogenase subunit C